tara:strand:- start:9272 stop:9697 length:426 start_codon:yes stop_codon:yes gene_type:complete
MARTNPQEFGEKWARRTKAATPDYQAGVRRVTEAPGIAAAANADRMVEGVQRSVTEGKWQARVSAVSLGDWQRSALEKGAQRIAAGVDGAQADVTKFAGELLTHVDAGVGQLAATPRGDLETNIQRMNSFVRHMSTFRRSP